MAEKKTTPDLNEVQEMIAKMLEDAKAEAAKIVADAKAAASGKMSAEEAEKRKKDAEYMDELVEIKLFKDAGKYKDDVFVGVNGDTILIKRGEYVKIKRKFAQVLEDSEHQDYETARLIERKTAEYERERAKNEN